MNNDTAASSSDCNVPPGKQQDTKLKSTYLDSKPRVRISDLAIAKKRGEKWAMLTCYDAISASVFDQARIPVLLVGDSAAQMVYGYSSTIPVTMDELIPLARAVAASCKRALVVADLPFGSYQESPQIALRNATRFMKEAQVHAVKLEGGKEYAEHVKLLTDSGIPVVGHVGFTPQSEHTLSGYKIQGREDGALMKICDDACKLQGAGAFSCVLELVPPNVGRAVTSRLSIPTIGIGAGPHCDAQILVWHDMAGFVSPRKSQYLVGSSSSSSTSSTNDKHFELSKSAKFVKRYANISEILYKAAKEYAEDVASGSYPATEHCYD